MTNYNEPLPSCEGPKLPPFPIFKAPIKFKSLVSDPKSEGHGHVFQVSIGSQVYALKIFKFYDNKEDMDGLDDDNLRHVSVDLVHCHMDPFFNECRSYGRLIEKKLNGEVAVRCYGYINLPAGREKELKQKSNVEDWDRPEDDYDLPLRQRPPLRAILKDYLPYDVPLTKQSAAKMLRDLRRMRRAGVYPMDIRERNYKGGLLVDMSIAMVKPHYLFDIRPEWQVKDMLQMEDPKNFQIMINNAGIIAPSNTKSEVPGKIAIS